MKHIISYIKHYASYCALCIVTLLVACDDQLDITPKGQTTLSNVTDLECLLNQEYGLGIHASKDLGLICNESLGYGTNLSEVMSMPNSLDYAYLTYDESVDRITLSQSDERYTQCYKYINYMNVILEKMPDAEGDATRKPQLMAEARIMRAYFHWLLVNIYAKQYDEATAATDGGIPYCDDTNVTEQKTKLTVTEVYDRILDDCSDEVIAALPANDNGNVLRADQAFGNAVRAKVLMQMKRYSEALPYAEQALAINGNIEDRSTIKETGAWSLPQDIADNYVYMGHGVRVSPCMEVLSAETGGIVASSGGGSFDDDDEDEGYDEDDDHGYDEEALSDGDDDYDDEDSDYSDDEEDDDGETTTEVDNGLFEPGDYLIKYTSEWSNIYGTMMFGLGVKYNMSWSAQGNVYGITSDHIYYVAAECLIRTGKIREGLAMVDKVRAYRIEDYEPFVDLYDAAGSMSEQEAMALMQKAKWIECIGTYENFFDTKRWNTESDYRRTITRSLGDYGTFSVSPDSKLWVLPFPANATRYNSSLTQNY